MRRWAVLIGYWDFSGSKLTLVRFLVSDRGSITKNLHELVNQYKESSAKVHWTLCSTSKTRRAYLHPGRENTECIRFADRLVTVGNIEFAINGMCILFYRTDCNHQFIGDITVALLLLQEC